MKNITTEQTKQRDDKCKIRQMIRAGDTGVVVKERRIPAVLLSSNPTSAPFMKYLDVRKKRAKTLKIPNPRTSSSLVRAKL
jgi:hypothetical protein